MLSTPNSEGTVLKILRKYKSIRANLKERERKKEKEEKREREA